MLFNVNDLIGCGGEHQPIRILLNLEEFFDHGDLWKVIPENYHRRNCGELQKGLQRPWKVTIEGTREIHRRDHGDPWKVTIEGTAETCGRDSRDPWKVTMEEIAEIHGRLLQKGPWRPVDGYHGRD